MGLDADRFAEPVDPALKCKLCGQVLEEPLSTPCGHVFCAGCLLPWAARRRLCPLRCKPISGQELHRVLPLENLVLRLAAKCDYSARGCRRRVPLHQLAAHVESCDYSPAGCRRLREVLLLEDLHMRESICQVKGCGGWQEPQPLQPGEEARCGAGDEGSAGCCARAVRTRRSADARLESAAKGRALQWCVREATLLGQLAALRSEVQLTALRYRQKFKQYVSHLSSIAGNHDLSEEGEPKLLTIMLHRKNKTLGFNIVGGQANQGNQVESAEGIYVSRIVENGPADKADGIQINDKIIEGIKYHFFHPDKRHPDKYHVIPAESESYSSADKMRK